MRTTRKEAQELVTKIYDICLEKKDSYFSALQVFPTTGNLSSQYRWAIRTIGTMRLHNESLLAL